MTSDLTLEDADATAQLSQVDLELNDSRLQRPARKRWDCVLVRRLHVFVDDGRPFRVFGRRQLGVQISGWLVSSRRTFRTFWIFQSQVLLVGRDESWRTRGGAACWLPAPP